MRFSPTSALCILSLLAGTAAGQETDEEDTVEMGSPSPLPRVDELVPDITNEMPEVEPGKPPERPYPNAEEILRHVREIPPLERSRGPVPSAGESPK